MADLFSLLLLLLPPVSCSLHTHEDPAVLPPPAQILAALRNQEAGHVDPKLTHAHVDQGNSKVGIFIVAAAGTCTFMAVVYCIYSKFYSKQPYLHTQLEEDSDLTGSPSMYFQAAGEADMRGGTGYGSLSDTPSVISVPPYLSPPPSSMPFPPLFASSSSCSSSRSLRTISAKDLQQSCI